MSIGFHNINGLKANRGKLENIIDYMEEKNIDIMGIGETNISEKEGRYTTRGNNNYGSFWVSADENKKKGSGIGIILKRTWEKHVAQVNRYNPYLLELTLRFKRLCIIVVAVYVAPENTEIQESIRKYLKEKREKRKGRHLRYIIMGDFNTNLDSSSTKDINRRKDKKTQITGVLVERNLVDIFLEAKPNRH